MMIEAHEGSCQCGWVKFRATAQPRDVHHCHCSMCRRATGGAFATLAWYKDAQIAWLTNQPASFRSSDIARRGYCPHCGSPIYLKYDLSTDIGLMIGVFAAPETLPPTHHYGVEAKIGWLHVDDDLPQEVTAADPRPS
ncbi:MAG TPA: GFA family protein [Dongiaceae bacterium]|nr:GFA family protein [Dongiaceae bacterium]